MTGFQFETGPQEGTNRSAPAPDCERCGGDRFVPVDVVSPVVEGMVVEYAEAYMRCPSCNAPGGTPNPVERRYDP